MTFKVVRLLYCPNYTIYFLEVIVVFTQHDQPATQRSNDLIFNQEQFQMSKSILPSILQKFMYVQYRAIHKVIRPIPTSGFPSNQSLAIHLAFSPSWASQESRAV